MTGHARQCVEKYLELANKKEQDLKQVPTPCLDDHQMKPEDFEVKGELTAIADRIVLKALYLARVNRSDILWTVNVLAREVTKWNVACDKRLHRLMCYIHFTRDHVLTCFVGDYPEDCRIALYSDASFAGDLRDSKSTSGGYLCLVGPRTFVPLTWLCKKQTAVSTSSSEAEVIALDTGTRLEGIPAFQLWEEITDVFHPEDSKSKRAREVRVSSRNIFVF